MIHPFPGLQWRQLIGARREGGFPLPPGSILTHLARTALVQAFRALGVGEGDEVLVPAFHCGAEIEAARFVGASVDFYPVPHSLRVDPASIAERINQRTRAVLLTHFYGISQDSIGVDQVCRDNGAALIEDCAHVFVGAAPGTGQPGTTGAISVYSLPKFLPVPDGGVLLFSNGSPGSLRPELVSPPQTPIARRVGRMLLDRLDEGHPSLGTALDRGLDPARWLFRLRRFQAGSSGASQSYTPAASAFEPSVVGWAASTVTRRILARLNPDEIAAKRRFNYRYLSDSLSSLSQVDVVAPKLADSAVPLVLPVRLQNRSDVELRLAQSGVSTYRFGAKPWPTFPEGEFAEAGELRNHLLGLPVHQELHSQQLDAIAAALRSSI